MFDSFRKTLDNLEKLASDLINGSFEPKHVPSDLRPKLKVFTAAASYTVDGSMKLFSSVVVTSTEETAMEKIKEKVREINPNKIVIFNLVVAVKISQRTVDKIKYEC